MQNISYLFAHFNGEKFPEISKWNTSKVYKMKRIFFSFFGPLPDISLWNTNNLIDMSKAFGVS